MKQVGVIAAPRIRIQEVLDSILSRIVSILRFYVFFNVVKQMSGQSHHIGHNTLLQVSFSPDIHDYNHHTLGAHPKGGCRAAGPQIEI
jgi:hypothetical protein